MNCPKKNCDAMLILQPAMMGMESITYMCPLCGIIVTDLPPQKTSPGKLIAKDSNNLIRQAIAKLEDVEKTIAKMEAILEDLRRRSQAHS